MPDVLLYLRAFLGSFSASAIIVLAFVFFPRRKNDHVDGTATSPMVALPGLGIGVLVGYRLLDFQWKWPPANAMDRFLVLILPITMIVEWLACVKIVPRSLIRILRGCVAAACGRTLLHGSAYLGDTAETWTAWQQTAILSLATLGLASVWLSLAGLSTRPGAASITMALAICIQCGGVVIMLAGYIKGGVAAIPLAGAVLATAIMTGLLRGTMSPVGPISVALVSLFSLLFIGRFFGAMSSAHALVIFFSPLLCWLTELPALRRRSVTGSPLKIGLVRLVLVCIPLLIVLLFSLGEFRKRFAPLLSRADFGVPNTQSGQTSRPTGSNWKGRESLFAARQSLSFTSRALGTTGLNALPSDLTGSFPGVANRKEP